MCYVTAVQSSDNWESSINRHLPFSNREEKKIKRQIWRRGGGNAHVDAAAASGGGELICIRRPSLNGDEVFGSLHSRLFFLSICFLCINRWPGYTISDFLLGLKFKALLSLSLLLLLLLLRVLLQSVVNSKQRGLGPAFKLLESSLKRKAAASSLWQYSLLFSCVYIYTSSLPVWKSAVKWGGPPSTSGSFILIS